MNTGMIPVRYAKALIAFAEERHCAEQVYKESCNVAAAFGREASLRRVLDNPVLSTARKSELIRTAAGGKVSDVFNRFTEVLLANRRENYLQQTSLMYMDLYRKANHISTARFETATEPEKEVCQRITQLIASREGGTVELTTAVKPELLGGFVFEMNSERLDASVATELHNIRKQFVEKNKRIV